MERNGKRKTRRSPGLGHERQLARSGYAAVAGLDEVGRGAWAGPVVAAAVILDPAQIGDVRRVRDSKQLTPRQRETLFPIVQASCVAWSTGLADACEIDAIGIVPATRLAMRRAIDALALPPDALIIDALRLPDVALPQRAFNFADAISLSVAAASILAKVTRDRMMIDLESAHPGYGFDRHKGYGTRAHHAALERLGACAAHRKTFRPIRLFSESHSAAVSLQSVGLTAEHAEIAEVLKLLGALRALRGEKRGRSARQH